MTCYRTVLALAGSLVAFAQADLANAQNGSTSPAAPVASRAEGAPSEATSGNEAAQQVNDDIVVTGTRVAGRSRLETASPIDVLSSAALRRQGSTELSQTLANIAPSIDFPRPSATDGTDAIRPITLRGLSPDQVLVLVNGVRGHTSALLNLNGSIGRAA
jgi:iron complex outermembrane receptor protein